MKYLFPMAKSPHSIRKRPFYLFKAGVVVGEAFASFFVKRSFGSKTASCDPKLRLKADVSMHFVDAM